MFRKALITVGVVLAVLTSGAVATASAPVPAPTGLEGSVGTVQPVRVLDTRTTGGPLAPSATRSASVIGLGDVPATGVTAVVANVTVTGATDRGFLTVWPEGAANPGTSNLNFAPSQDVPNLVVTKVGANGGIQIFNGSGGTVNVIVDVTGYVADPKVPVPAQTTITYAGAFDAQRQPLPNAPALRVGQGSSGVSVIPAGYTVNASPIACEALCPLVPVEAGWYVHASSSPNGPSQSFVTMGSGQGVAFTDGIFAGTHFTVYVNKTPAP